MIFIPGSRAVVEWYVVGSKKPTKLCHHYAAIVSPDEMIKLLVDLEEKASGEDVKVRLPAVWAYQAKHRELRENATPIEVVADQVHLIGTAPDHHVRGCTAKLGITWKVWEGPKWQVSMTVGNSRSSSGSYGPCTLDELYSELGTAELLEIMAGS